MGTLNDELLNVHKVISMKDEDRKPYTNMFEYIRDRLLKEMCDVEPLFHKMFKGTMLFGSYPNRVRIIKPNEFDVFILLDFPFKLKTNTHPDRPGFIEIKSGKWKKELNRDVKCAYEDMFYRKSRIFTTCLNRNRFKGWIKSIIEDVLENGDTIPGYEIDYCPCNVANTIKVREKILPYKQISIDFVPAIILSESNALSILDVNIDKEYLESFVAIPKSLPGCGAKSSRPFAFQFVNPVAERDLIWDKYNLKIVYRLLKALRNNYPKLHRLKSYFLTAIFLLEVNKRNVRFWQQPVGTLFLHMLSTLIFYYCQGFLPFYWAPSFNLLSILKEREIAEHTDILKHVYGELSKISSYKKISSDVVKSYFKTRR